MAISWRHRAMAEAAAPPTTTVRPRFTALAQSGVLVVIAGIIGGAIHAPLGLYADGSYFLLQVLSRDGFWAIDPFRSFGQFVTQFPVVLALKSGVRDLNTLTQLHTAGLVLAPLLVWMAALLYHLGSGVFWLFVVSFSVTFLTSGFFVIGEYNLASALAALSAAILLKSTPMRWIDGLFLAAAALVVVKAYESTAFLGPLLIVLCVARLLTRRDDDRLSTLSLAVATALFAIGGWLAATSIIAPLSPGNMGNAIQLKPLMTTWHFAYLVAMGLLMVAAATCRDRYYMAALTAALGLSLAYVLFPRFWNPPALNYPFRVLCSLMLFSTLCIAALCAYADRWPGRFAPSGARTMPVAVACFAALSIAFCSNLIGLHRWVALFKTEVLARRGLVAIEDTALAGNAYNWTWTNPSLSLVLRGDLPGATIMNARDYSGWIPFAAEKSPVLGPYRKDAPRLR